MSVIRQRHLPALEGIRGLGFLVVFVGHYTFGLMAIPPHISKIKYLYLLAFQVSWVAVPIFFVLSGFLITGILYDTRELGSFFRVFYTRRAFRVLPLYYLILAAGAIVLLIHGIPFIWKQALFLVYLHNLIEDNYTSTNLLNLFQLSHLWSLAVEEQFYLVWPVAVWFCRSRRKLIALSYAVIVAVALLRVIWPMMHWSYYVAYESTFTRCDALMMGAVLALHKRGPVQNFKSLIRPAKLVLVATIGIVLARAIAVGQALPYDAFGLIVLMPLMNLMALALVILAIEPETAMARVCSRPWAVRLGKMTYSLYVIHEPLSSIFRMKLIPAVASATGSFAIARVTTNVVAFAVTYGLASLTYRFVEQPALRMKDKFRYGGPQPPHPKLMSFKKQVKDTISRTVTGLPGSKRKELTEPPARV